MYKFLVPKREIHEGSYYSVANLYFREESVKLMNSQTLFESDSVQNDMGNEPRVINLQYYSLQPSKTHTSKIMCFTNSTYSIQYIVSDIYLT